MIFTTCSPSSSFMRFINRFRFRIRFRIRIRSLFNISKIKQSIFRLKEKGLIEKNAKAYDITDKGIEKKSEPIKTTEIKTVYKYAVRTPTPPLKGNSRKYCSDLMAKSVGNHWTYEQLEKMENEFGFNAFDYRGGWWTNANTGETTPYCRHIWKAKTIRIDK